MSTQSRVIVDTAPRPIAATIAVVIRNGQVLLVRRRNPPDAGRWGFPGGKIEVGETIAAAAVRELHEETGVRGKAGRIFTAIDVFDRDAHGELSRHFILIAVLCRWLSGEPVAGDDALEARWFGLTDLDQADLAMSFGVLDVVRQAHALALGDISHRPDKT